MSSPLAVSSPGITILSSSVSSCITTLFPTVYISYGLPLTFKASIVEKSFAHSTFPSELYFIKYIFMSSSLDNTMFSPLTVFSPDISKLPTYTPNPTIPLSFVCHIYAK